MTNYRSDQETDLAIFVNTVTVASKLYELKPLIFENKGDIIDAKKSSIGHAIGWAEQITMHYLIKPIDQGNAVCSISNCSVGNTMTYEPERGSNITDFICLEHAYDKFKVNDVHLCNF